MAADYTRGKNKNQILFELAGTAQPGSPIHEQQKMAILVRCTEDLEQKAIALAAAMDAAADRLDRRGEALTAAIDRASDSSGRLSAVLVWLNILLAAGTTVAAVAAVAALFR